MYEPIYEGISYVHYFLYTVHFEHNINQLFINSTHQTHFLVFHLHRSTLL